MIDDDQVSNETLSQNSNIAQLESNETLSNNSNIIQQENKDEQLSNETVSQNSNITQLESNDDRISNKISPQNTNIIQKKNLDNEPSNKALLISKTDDIPTLQNKKYSYNELDQLNTGKHNNERTRSKDNDHFSLSKLLTISLLSLFLLLQFLISLILLFKVKRQEQKIKLLEKEQAHLDSQEFINSLNENNKTLGMLLEKSNVTIKQSPSVSQQNNNNVLEEQHELIKLISNRLTFIKVTLSKMDPKVRGYKQLSKSIEQIYNNLKVKGYEIIDYINEPYNDGMKVIANFIEDDSLDVGTQIITSATKPQINYNGKMIQSAEITVSQNI